MNIPLGKSDDNLRFAEQLINTETDIAFDYMPIHEAGHADPEVKIKD
jgi:hypothetical protein